MFLEALLLTKTGTIFPLVEQKEAEQSFYLCKHH